MIHWSATTGANIVARFEKNALQAEPKEVKYRAKGKGLDYRGDQKWIEYTIHALLPAMSNETFTTVVVSAIGVNKITMRLYHSSTYGSPS